MWPLTLWVEYKSWLFGSKEFRKIFVHRRDEVRFQVRHNEVLYYFYKSHSGVKVVRVVKSHRF
jgi:hypothetical protein